MTTANEPSVAELRALVKDRLDWYTRSGRTKTMLSGEWIERARKVLSSLPPERANEGAGNG